MARERPPRLLTFGPLHRVRIQVGYRAAPDGPAYQQYLLDLPVRDEGGERDALEDAQVVATLEPVLHAGAEAPRHYSLHQHRSHSSWGVSPNALEIGLLVTTGARTEPVAAAADTGVIGAFRDLMELVGPPEHVPTSRDEAILRARRSVVAEYDVDPESLRLSTEEHHPGANSWTMGLRTADGQSCDVLVGLVDGYAGSIRVRHAPPTEVSDSVGSE